ncbi:MAG: tail fiber domain-containing protein [Saprospiraceae bacterium]|nr:tail fiber domain-containing protein [Saprospiraceae bacterium]
MRNRNLPRIAAILFFFSSITTALFSQISINQDNSTPDPSAMLDIKSSDKGMLIPRMTTAERNAIASPAAGLIIYNTQDSCFNYFTGTAWVKDCGRSLTADQKPAFIGQAGGIDSEQGYGIAADAAGNIYVTGAFRGTATFDSQTLTSSGNSDAFVVKYDPTGNVLWAIAGGGSGSDAGAGIATDALGYVYVTGWFSNTATFGSQSVASSGEEDVFVAKYDAAGNVMWVVSAGGANEDFGLDIATEAGGNVNISGFFQGTATFGSQTLTGSGQEDVFTAKFDAVGNVLWVASGGGSSQDYGNSLVADASGNVYVTGWFTNAATFGSQTLTSAGSRDVFVVKYDPAGNVLWAADGGGTSNDLGQGITADAAGNVYVTGSFQGTATFGSQTATSTGVEDVFIAKYDAAGNVVWVAGAGGANTEIGNSIAMDAAGNAYVTGNFSGTTSLGSQNLSSMGSYDVFAFKADATGNILWAVGGGGPNSDSGTGIVADAAGKVYVTGHFQGTAIFGSRTLTSAGSFDMFVIQYTSDGEDIVSLTNLSDSQDKDIDPTNELQNLDLSGATLSIENGNTIDLTSLPFASNWNLSGNAGTDTTVNFIGTTDTMPMDFRVNNERVLRLEYAKIGPHFAPNIIGGTSKNAVNPGVYGATISGGGTGTAANLVTGSGGTVSGGSTNTADINAVVGGGTFNTAGGVFSAVGGGTQNIANGQYSVVPGGMFNEAAGNFSFAAGNHAQANHNGAFVWADGTNTAFNSTAANQFLIRAANGVGINKNNPATALDVNGTITATTFAGDGSALTGIPDDQTLSLSGTTLSIEDGNSVDLSGIDTDTDDQTLSLSGTTLSIVDGNSVDLVALPFANNWSLSGNAGTDTTVNFIGTTDNMPLDFRVNNLRGLRLEYAENDLGVPGPNIIGGYGGNNVNPGIYSATISGGGRAGEVNSVTGGSGTIGGGSSNTAGGIYATVGGGYNNTSNAYSTIGGGASNIASSNYSTVGGGGGNIASGSYATIPGGLQNEATDDYSFAAGRLAKARHKGTFVWADNTVSNFGSTATNQFLIRAGNGVGINKNNPATALDVNGAVTATAFVGDGSALSGIPDDQTLSLSGTTLSIEAGNSVDLSTLPGDNLGNHMATQNIQLDGNYLSGDGDNEGVFVDTDGNVGIGNINPTELLHVGSASHNGDQSIALQNASNLWKHTVALNGSYQIRDGDAPRLTVLGTNGNVGIGFTSPVNTLTVGGTADFTDNVGIGTASPGARLEVEGGASVDDYVAIIHNTSTDPDNDTRYNGLRIQAGKVNNNNANSRMIGFYNPNNLEIGSIRQNNSNTVSYNTSSDIRLKQNIAPTGFSLDDLMRIQVRDYEFRAAPGLTETGFIAQQLYTVYPGAVSKGGDDVTTDPWMVDYGKLTPLLVKAVQDQQALIEAQKQEIEALERQNAAFEKRLEQLEIGLQQYQQSAANSRTSDKK